MDGDDSTKLCLKCGIVKLVSHFYVNKRGTPTSPCKDCRKAYIRQWNAANKERVAEYKRRWIEDHPGYKAQYYEANAERIKAKSNRYYKENRAEILSRTSAAYDENKSEEAVERQRRWRKENPETFRAQVARRTARQKAAFGDISGEDIQQMYDDQGGLCAYCEAPLFGNFEVEHMIPLSRGGAHDWTNIAVSCPPCNRRKHCKTAEEFIAVLYANN